jgi:hypothetical protein
MYVFWSHTRREVRLVQEDSKIDIVVLFPKVFRDQDPLSSCSAIFSMWLSYSPSNMARRATFLAVGLGKEKKLMIVIKESSSRS